MNHKHLDEKTYPEIAKARKAVGDAVNLLLETVASLETAYADAFYQEAFNDGVAWLKEEFSRMTEANKEVETIPVKANELTEVEKLAQNSIVSCVTANPGLRTSDVTRRIMALPVKPALSEEQVRGMINRLKNEGRIENKAGRWYSTKAKSALPAYQVMTYLPDGSKYLGADVIR